ILYSKTVSLLKLWSLLQRHVAGQHDGEGAHRLRLRVLARQLPGALAGLCRRQELAPGHDDAVVGRDRMLPRSILDRPHAFLDGGVLLPYADHAAEAAPFLLRLAVDQIIVVAVTPRQGMDRAGFDSEDHARMHAP